MTELGIVIIGICFFGIALVMFLSWAFIMFLFTDIVMDLRLSDWLKAKFDGWGDKQ